MSVSVIIPAYNAAATIAKAIRSVIAQTCRGWEAIVVDDGSGDATAEIAGTMAARDARIRVIRQPNGGESAARNAGIGLAGYDWLLFLDADDWIAPTHLERMTSELASDPELDAVLCGWVRVAMDGTHVADDYRAPAGDLFPTLARRAAFPVNSCIVRKSLVETVGKFDTSLRKSADWDLWQRLARTGARFGRVNEVLAYYRMLPGSASLEAGQLLSDGLIVLKRGHSRDPRVPNPHPDHANGYRHATVESQEFYLLCWCAGLMLGAGKDARSLLEAVKDDHCRELYPDAIARCIFESATLPACRPRSAWEDLWPAIGQLVGDFLVALEEQSQTPNLARRSLTELKLAVLKHSPTWGPVVAQQEETMDWWRRRAEALAKEKEAHEAELGESRRLTRERELILARLQDQAWVRLGLRAGLVKAPDSGDDGRGAGLPDGANRGSR